MTAKKDIKTLDRFSIIRTPCPINIIVCIKIKLGLFGEKNTIIQGSFQVTEYVFNSCPMRYFGSMHKLTYFVHRIRNVVSSKGEVL